MNRRSTPEADAQRAIVQALRFALPRDAIVHHCANEVTEAGPRGAKRQAILVGMVSFSHRNAPVTGSSS